MIAYENYRFHCLKNQCAKPRCCLISIGNIFLKQGDNINETQFISASRYLDVKQYCEKKNLQIFHIKILFVIFCG